MTTDRTDVRLAALEGVLHETRLTMDGTFQAVAGVLSHVPGIAQDLRAAAALTADAPITEPDPHYRDRVVASRADIVSILNAMAATVDANVEKARRLIIETGAGVQ